MILYEPMGRDMHGNIIDRIAYCCYCCVKHTRCIKFHNASGTIRKWIGIITTQGT
jgi:hypothetical protein